MAQPDDREHRQGGEEEACMAVLNNFYGDGEEGDIVWAGKISKTDSSRLEQFPLQILTSTFRND